jgi:hypothetical protein
MKALLHLSEFVGYTLMLVALGVCLASVIASALTSPVMQPRDNRSLAAKLQDSKIQQRAMEVANARGRAK